MKLYIWTGFCPDWSSGLAVAIADTEEEAKKLVIDDLGYDLGDWGDWGVLEVREITKFARAVPGGG